MMGGFVPPASLAKTFLALAIFAALLGAIAAFGLSGEATEMPLAQVEAAEKQAAIAQNSEKWAMEKPYYARELAAQANQAEAILQAETEAAEARLAAEVANYEASLADQRAMELARQEFELTVADRWNSVSSTLVLFLGIVLILVPVAALTKLIFRQVDKMPLWQTASTDPWQDPEFRRKMVELGRQRNRSQPAPRSPAPNGTGRPNHVPLYQNGSRRQSITS